MENLFELEFEKYFAIPSNYSPERKATEIRNHIMSDEYIGSLKKDGNMSRFVKQDGRMALQSRNRSTVTKQFTDKIDYVPHIISSLKKLPDNTILIGELYYHGGNSDKVGEILRCKAEKAVARQDGAYGKLYYYIHDCWMYGGTDMRLMPYEKRIKIVQQLVPQFNNPYIEMPHYVYTPADINDLIQWAFEHDEEGLVLVRKNAIVEPGKRTAWKTIKVKRELDKEIDCFTTGHYKEATYLYEGKELETWKYWENTKTGELIYDDLFDRYKYGEPFVPVTKPFFYGWASSIELGWYDEQGNIEVIGYVSGVEDFIKKDIVENNEAYVLRPCRVTAMEWTKDGALRHPKFKGFRDDIDATDCRKDKIFNNNI